MSAYTPHSPDYTPHSPDYMPHSPIQLAPVPEKAKRRSADAKTRKQQETGPGKPRDDRPIVYSIVIPRVFKNIGEKRIRAIIYKLDFGFLQRVDIVPKQGKNFNVVFLHFSEWNTNPTANATRSRLDSGENVKIVYENPWFWLIKKSEATRPEDRPKKPQRPAPFIDFYHKPKTTAEPTATATAEPVTFEESTYRGGAAYGKKSYTIRVKLDAIERDAEATEALYVKDPASESGFRIRTQSGMTVHTFADYVMHHNHLLKKDYSLPDTLSSLWCEIDVLVENEWVPGNRFFTLAQPSADVPTMPEEDLDGEAEFRRKKEMNAFGI